MPVSRHYKCNKCDNTWWQEYNPCGENPVFCPSESCGDYKGELAKPHVKSDATTIRSQAMEITQGMMENEYGIAPSMMKDNLREGDVGVKTAPTQTQAHYVKQSKTSISQFLTVGRAAGGLGENNISGIDIIQGASRAGTIPDPRKNMIAISTKD